VPGVARWALLSILSVTAVTVSADIYRYVDPSGTVHFTDRPVHSGFKLFMRTKASPPSPGPAPAAAQPTRSTGWKVGGLGSARGRAYNALVEQASQRWGVNPALIHAVITAESNYNPEAMSHAGAMGLMQLMPGTAKRFGVADPWDPHQNVNGGTKYLRELLDRFRSLKLALAAYNAGEGAVEQHGNQIPPYAETQHYVQKVMGLFFQGLERDG
jgi:soluble lytic murein transglycosylase-like protein